MTEAIEQYWKEKAAYNEAQNPKVLFTPSNSPMVNGAVLFRNIKDRNIMTENELRYFISMNLSAILNKVMDSSVGSTYIDAFQDVRFLDAFIDVISANYRSFDINIIVHINLIIYHYIVYQDQNQSSNKSQVLDRMMRIASIVNAGLIARLKKYNMPEGLEQYIALARLSDFDIKICVKRVNFILITSTQLMSQLGITADNEVPQSAIEFLANLLVELFDLQSWDQVLPYFMMDTLPNDTDDPRSQWVTSEVENMDSAISLAILHILNYMIAPTNRLYNMLYSYAEGYRIMSGKQSPRFSFRSISEDYPRIREVVASLEDDEKIYMP